MDELIAQGEESGISLSIETPDDLAPKKKRSATDIAKGLVKGIVHQEEETPAPAKKGTGTRKKSTPASKFFQQKCALIASGLIWLLLTMAPKLGETFEINEEQKQLAPTDKQAEDIVKPLLSILDRHIPIGELSPDVVDISDFIAASVSYFFELKATMIMLEAVKEHEKEKENQNHYAKDKAAFPLGTFEYPNI